MIDEELFKQILFVIKLYLINMKLIISLIAILLLSNCNNTPIIQTKYITIRDTIEVENVIKIANLQRELDLTKDSLSYVKDSLGEDLFIARYKLGRIKYYNEIAAKGNNIKYLRGWINRVLNN